MAGLSIRSAVARVVRGSLIVLILASATTGRATEIGTAAAPAVPEASESHDVDSDFVGTGDSEPNWDEEQSPVVARTQFTSPSDSGAGTNGVVMFSPNAPVPGGRSAFGPPGGKGGGGGPFAPKFGYEAIWLPSQNVIGQREDASVWRQEVSGSFPIAPLASGLVSGTFSIGDESIVTDAILPDSRIPFPGELWNVRLGANYMRKFDNGWVGGGGIGFGSASDEPFSSFDVLVLTANAYVRVPQGERDAWLFSLFYSPMSEIWFPIPGVAYQWQPNEAFKASIGLPFSLNYQPTERVAFEASYVPVRNIKTRASYAILDSLKAYAGYVWSNRIYFLADRRDDDERFFAYEQRVASGLEWTVTDLVTVDLSGGYAFDRFYFQGNNFDDRHQDRVDLEDGPFVAGQVQARW